MALTEHGMPMRQLEVNERCPSRNAPVSRTE
jgi:hypothetical protein